MEGLKPSDFSEVFPGESVLRKRESETVALNIMTIMERTGDIFRVLSFEEYETERSKDGGITDHQGHDEEYYFDKVQKYCVSAEQSSKFSPFWNKIFTGQV